MIARLKHFLAYVGESVFRELPFFFVCTLLLSVPAGYTMREADFYYEWIWFFTASVQGMAVATLCCVLIRLAGSWLRWVFLALWLLLFVFDTFTFYHFETRISPIILSLILQTDGNEASNFFSVYVWRWSTLWYLLLVIAVSVVIIVCSRWWRRRYKATPFRHFAAAGFFLTLIFIFGMALACYTVSTDFRSSVGSTTVTHLDYSCSRVLDKRYNIDDIYEANNAVVLRHKPESAPVIVCVVGESHIKAHNSLYGYALPTNPNMSSERDKGSLFVFDDVVSPFNQTNTVMELFYSLKSINDTCQFSRMPLFPAVFKKAGFKVALIDNQITRTAGDIKYDFQCSYYLNPVKIHRQCFDYRSDTKHGLDLDKLQHDVPHLFHGPRSLNIIHLLGQHLPPERLYPHGQKEWETFTADDVNRPDLTFDERSEIAKYDNCTRYNDAVLKFIIDKFRQDDAVVIYFADHGEQLYDDSRHRAGRTFGALDAANVKSMFEVPFFIWVSDACREKHPDLVNRIAGSVDRPYSLDDVCYLLFDIANIDFKGNRPDRSVINSAYRQRERILIMNEQRYHYDRHKKEIDRVKLLTPKQPVP